MENGCALTCFYARYELSGIGAVCLPWADGICVRIIVALLITHHIRKPVLLHVAAMSRLTSAHKERSRPSEIAWK